MNLQILKDFLRAESKETTEIKDFQKWKEEKKLEKRDFWKDKARNFRYERFWSYLYKTRSNYQMQESGNQGCHFGH